MTFHITAFYRFSKISDDLDVLKSKITAKAQELDTTGLMVLGAEGINSTISASSAETLADFKKFIQELLGIEITNFKDSYANKKPFRKFVVKVREEIVTLGTPELVPNMTENNHHLSPAEWNEVMKNEKDYVIIDTRNWYEYNIGSFKGAINPNIDKFTEFPKYLEEQKVSKDKKMLIFCTGGIRCEKGILELQRQGYQNVFQLEGGILKYLEEFPNEQFEGECFVFDHRVALDQDLKPTTKYGLCPHCGQPASISIDCKRCDTQTLICGDCERQEWKNITCSKNCAYQYQLHPERKAPPQQIFWKQPKSQQ